MVTRREFLAWGLMATAATACGRGGTTSPVTTPAPTGGVPDLSALADGSRQTGDSFLVHGARVFDGSRHLGTPDVLVRDGVIAAVGEGLEADDSTQRLDAGGATLLPGLIDAHTHVHGGYQLGLALLFGVTTELDMFSLPEVSATLRAGVTGPRTDLRSAGYLATAPGGHGTQFGIDVPTLTDPGEADQWVADRLAEGSDYIKVVVSAFADASLDPPVVEALAAAARDRGVLSIAHVERRAHALQVIEAGVDGLAHAWLDEPPDGELLEAAAERDVFMVGTLGVFTPGQGAAMLDDARLRPWLPDAAVRHLELEPGFPISRRMATVVGRVAQRYHDAGLRVLAGSDTPNAPILDGVSMHGELELLVEAGLEPTAALAAATSVPADAFSLHDRGRIEPGRRADLLLVDGDPTEDITVTRSIRGIWQQGHPVDRSALFHLLEQEAEEQAGSPRLVVSRGARAAGLAGRRQGR